MHLYDETDHRFFVLSTEDKFPSIRKLLQAPPVILDKHFVYRPIGIISVGRGLEKLAEDAHIQVNAPGYDTPLPATLINSAVQDQVIEVDDTSDQNDWRLCKVELQASELIFTFVSQAQLRQKKLVLCTMQLSDVIILHMECRFSQQRNKLARSEHYACSTDPCVYLTHKKSFHVAGRITQLYQEPQPDAKFTSSESEIVCRDSYL